MNSLEVMAEPCTSCSYRKDTPPGVWHESEYEKLRGYDEDAKNPCYETFLCHHSSTQAQQAVCRGWLHVHRNSVAARLAVATGRVPVDALYTDCKTPLYASGNEAADAGRKGVDHPSPEACQVVQRLQRKRRRKRATPKSDK